MRVGIDLVSESGRVGGVHTYTNRLLEAMLAALAEPAIAGPGSSWDGWELVVFHHDDYQWLFPIDDFPGVRRVSTGQNAPGPARRRLMQQSVVPAMARREGVDVVHSLNNVVPLRLDRPSVVTVHDLSPFVLPRRFSFLKRRFLRWAVPRSVHRASAVIAVSESTRRQVLRTFRGVAPEKVRTVWHGVDPSFQNPEATPDAVMERLALPDSYVLSVGAAEPGKNLLGTTRALEIVRERSGERIPWVVAGLGGPYRRVLERAWGSSPIGLDVRPLGVVSDEQLRGLYRRATAFLFPSLYEGFGLPLIEAFASGTPAIVSGGDSALAEVAGNAALLVDPGDPADIARQILRVWRFREVRALLSMRGARRVGAFDWGNAARDTLAIYRDVGDGAGTREQREAVSAV